MWVIYLIKFCFQKVLSYRVSLTYILNNVDHVFTLSVTSTPVKPGEKARVRLVFKPRVAGQSYTDYYVVDDTGGNSYKLTVTGRCFGNYNETFNFCEFYYL